LAFIGIVSYCVGTINAKSAGTHESTTSTVICYDQHGHVIPCPYSKLSGIIVGSILGVAFGGLLIWAMVDWCVKWIKKRKRAGKSPGDVEASPAPFRNPPSKSWFHRLVPNIFSSYREIPNRPDTLDSAVHDASGAADDEDNKKPDYRASETSKDRVPSSPASEVSVPLPPYESIAHSPPVWMPPK